MHHEMHLQTLITVPTFMKGASCDATVEVAGINGAYTVQVNKAAGCKISNTLHDLSSFR